MAPNAVLVDLDGTIWDSYPWYAARLAETGNISRAAVLQALTSGESIVTLLRKYGAGAGTLTHQCSGLSLFPGVAETLKQLAVRRRALGVVTSLPGRLAIPMLTAVDLKNRFGTVIHAGNCRLRKPNPGPIFAALEDLQAAAAGTIYIGDTERDAETARRAGVPFIWASYGYGSTRPDSTAHVLKRFADILDL